MRARATFWITRKFFAARFCPLFSIRNPKLVMLALPAVSVVEPSSVEMSDVEVSEFRISSQEQLCRGHRIDSVPRAFPLEESMLANQVNRQGCYDEFFRSLLVGDHRLALFKETIAEW